MPDGNILQRLKEDVFLSGEQKLRMRRCILNRIQPPVARTAQMVEPSTAFRIRLKDRIQQRIKTEEARRMIFVLARDQYPHQLAKERIRQTLAFRMRARSEQTAGIFHTGLKWTAAFVLFAFIVQSLPRALIAPTLRADTAVQLVPNGRVTVVMGSIEAILTAPEVLKGPTTVRTGDSEAIITLNDDGQVRIAPYTTVRLNDLSDRPQMSIHPTLTLKTGSIWLLGMVSPLIEPITVETGEGIVSIHNGSASIVSSGGKTTVVVLDHGAGVQRGKEEAYPVVGEQIAFSAISPLVPVPIDASTLKEPWVNSNLALDDKQRLKALKDQEMRRTQVAGILPTSSLYPLKRIAEEVDIALTPGENAKAQKRLQLAQTRLNEAIALLGEGDKQQAQDSIEQYRQTILAVANEPGDNLVKYLIKQQVDEATATVAVATPDTELYTLKQAVLDLSQSLPIAQVKSEDAQGYVFVDKLASLNESLEKSKDLKAALSTYKLLQPYADTILSDKGASPLLQREARSLLAKTSSLLTAIGPKGEQGPEVAMVQKDLAKYLPSEPERKEELVMTEYQINAVVDKVLHDIYVYRTPTGRYNTLINAMNDLEGNPNYGTILRRLERKLPANGLAGYVKTRIVEYGQHLKVAECKKEKCSGSGMVAQGTGI